MNRHPGFRVEEIRGRLLHEQLLAEAMNAISVKQWPDRIDPPHFPQIARTDTGTMRAVVIAS